MTSGLSAKKLAFVTSGLEPGIDGVADYNRLLAQALTRRGHQCLLISLNDGAISQVYEGDMGIDGKVVHILRLPGIMDWSTRVDLAHKTLSSFAADWVSLQFVCYGFQKTGILLFENRWLARLLEGYRLHMMFHETWVGQGVDTKFKNKIVGNIQKHFILKLTRRLRPRLIHTTNHHYAHLLRNSGLPAKVLPTISAIPVGDTNADDWLFIELRAAGLDVNEDNRNRCWLIGLFGGIDSRWPAGHLFRQLQSLADERGRSVAIISIGRIGPNEAQWNDWAASNPQMVFLKLGEQSTETISQLLNTIDFGLTSRPYLHIVKSGSVAAMLEHGVPVIISWGEIKRGESLSPVGAEPLLFKADKRLGERLDGHVRGPARGSRLPMLASQLLNDLSEAEQS